MRATGYYWVQVVPGKWEIGYFLNFEDNPSLSSWCITGAEWSGKDHDFVKINEEMIFEPGGNG
jgi:hypothetical protein